MRYELVVPTLGRPSLTALLASLSRARGPAPDRVLLVDDRREPSEPLLPGAPVGLAVEVLAGRAAGPAAARNVGWRAARSEWVTFLDDDVEVEPSWCAALERDLAGVTNDVAASQGRITVPLPAGRAAIDWERNVRGLESAAWASADIAYRRSALEQLGGFDERFPRAYREDADLALRALRAGWRLERGRRGVVHRVRPAGYWTSVRLQAGNADDAMMRALHGRRWREHAEAPAGRLRKSVLTSSAAVAGLGALAAGRPRAAAAPAAVWGAMTAQFAWRRIAPGPRTPGEVVRMLITSVLIPPAATAHRLRGELRAHRLARAPTGRPDA